MNNNQLYDVEICGTPGDIALNYQFQAYINPADLVRQINNNLHLDVINNTHQQHYGYLITYEAFRVMEFDNFDHYIPPHPNQFLRYQEVF
jgi:hypothetical protein